MAPSVRVWSAGRAAPDARTRAPTPRSTQGRRRDTARAPRASEDDEGKRTDWDSSWRKFRDQYVDVYDEGGDGGYGSRESEYGKAARDQIKADERRALNAVVNEQFTKTGFGVIALTLFVYVFVIGPPPDDGRCTLPWC